MLKPLPPRRARGIRLARATALFAIVIVVEAALARRFDIVDTETLYAALAAASLLALVSLLSVLVAMRDVWRDGSPGFGAALVAMVLTLFALLPFGAAAAAVAYFPPLYDVATDPEDPLPFRLRPEVGAPPLPGVAPVEDFPVLQEEAYPDLAPRSVPLSTVEAHAAAHLAVQELGWDITFESEPADESAAGFLEAEARSAILGIPDDVGIRISPFEGGSRIDVRSASRLPVHDLGENARRIRAFFDRFDEVKDRSAAG